MYYESAKGIKISAKRARQEIENHDCSWDEFISECGLKDIYSAQAVLRWLGY